MIKNIVIAMLLVALYMKDGSNDCAKPTPRMEGGCVIQSTPTGELKTCG